jgi:cell division protein FtsL
MSDLPSPLVAPIASSMSGAISARPVAASDERRGAGVGAFLLAIVTAGALAHVAVRIKSIEVAYALGRERHIATDLEEQRRRLQIEIGMLKDPGRVVMIARDNLKMGPPGPDVIRALGDARSLTDIAPVAVPPAGSRAPAPRSKASVPDPGSRPTTPRGSGR